MKASAGITRKRCHLSQFPSRRVSTSILSSSYDVCEGGEGKSTSEDEDM